MDKTEINTIMERQVRRQRWNEAPARLHNVYDSISGEMGHSCILVDNHHHRQVNATRTLLVFLLLLTAPFSLKTLTRDYPYRFVAENGVEVTTGVIESLDILFGKQ